MDTTPLKPIDDSIVKLLYAQHLQFLAFLTKHLGDRAAAEDVLQDCLAKALRQSGQIRDEESIIAWFYRILRNAVTDYYRHRGVDERKHAGLLVEMIEHQEDRSHPAIEAEAEVCRCFAGLLDTLKPAYAELLRRIDLGDETAAEVAAQLGITKANLNVRLHRARQALKTSLEQSCGTCAAHGCLDCRCE